MSVQEPLLYVDLRSPTLVQPLDAALSAKARESKFIEIDVVRATNPRRLPVTIEVEYAPANAARVHLGSFSLFPSDNPGKFIVPTQGKVQAGGAVVLSLQKPDKATAADTVRLGVRPIVFRSR